jgi:two-component system nitrogen regulation response regulator GlnG
VDSESGPLPDLAWDTLAEFVEAAVTSGETDVYRRALERFDRLVISHVMQNAGGQQNRAAEILGLSRVTLRTKLRHMQMSIEKTLTRREPESKQE